MAKCDFYSHSDQPIRKGIEQKSTRNEYCFSTKFEKKPKLTKVAPKESHCCGKNCLAEDLTAVHHTADFNNPLPFGKIENSQANEAIRDHSASPSTTSLRSEI